MVAAKCSTATSGNVCYAHYLYGRERYRPVWREHRLEIYGLMRSSFALSTTISNRSLPQSLSVPLAEIRTLASHLHLPSSLLFLR